MSSREMVGTRDLTGSIVNNLRVDSMIARHPAPRYTIACTLCGTQSTAGQRELTSGVAVCRNGGCTREALADESSLTLAQFTRREEQKKRAHIDGLQRQFQNTAKQLAETVRSSIRDGRDPDLYIDPATAYESMTHYEARVFNEREAQRFISENPDYLPCPENVEVILSYLTRNGIDQIVSTETLTAAFQRLDKYGLLKRHADAQPEPQTVAYEPPIAEPVPIPKPTTFEGWDLQTGEPCVYTERQVNRMSSLEMKRALRLYPNTLALPNIGPGPGRRA